MLFSACDSFFTTSVASWLARDIDYSSLSLDELLTLATTRGATSSDAAKEILAALANVSEAELKSLSTEQKETILTTAVTAAFGLDSVLSAVESLTSEDADTSDILNQLSSLADSGVDMTAVTILLGDETTLAEASVDTLILASVAVITTVGDDDIDSIISAVENESTDGLSGELLETADILIGVVQVLESDRTDDVDELGESLGFDLSELIPGFGS